MLLCDEHKDMLPQLQDVAIVDEDLLAHEEHLKYRYKQFLDTKEALEKAEGSIADFAKVRTSPQVLCTFCYSTCMQNITSVLVHECVVPPRS